MFLKKDGFPEEDELVMCTITKVQPHSVFCNLDEYDKGAMIHISEVSPGRIRNISDFVKEGKKVVCKVLKITEEKGHIDLSLRRVNEREKRNKIDEIKKQQLSEKIIEFVANSKKEGVEKLFWQISKKALQEHSSVYDFFQESVTDSRLLDSLELKKDIRDALEEVVKQRIKQAEVAIEGKLKLTSYAINGIDVVKSSLSRALQKGGENIQLKYLGAGTYHVQIKAKDYKEAEGILKESIDAAIGFVSKNEGEGTFTRTEP